MTINNRDKAKSARLLYWVNGYIYLTATALALVGLFLLYTWWSTQSSNDWWLGQSDPLLELSNRAMLFAGGLLHLAAAVYLFATRDVLTRVLAVLWVGLNHLMYYAGVHLVEPSMLPNTEHFIGWRLQIQATAVDFWWKAFLGYLIVTSAVFLALKWHQSKKIRKEAWFEQWQENRRKEDSPHVPSFNPASQGRSLGMVLAGGRLREQNKLSQRPISKKSSKMVSNYLKMSCPACGGRVKFAVQNIGQQISCPHCQAAITLRKPEEKLRMTCVLCRGSIEFPAHALGQKISCPHCAKTITLLKLA